MFSTRIIDSDAFLDMPLSTQALYFHLSMRADDDGFLNNAKRIMDMINANQNDYDLLLAKAFIIQFPDGICVIKHWRINNYIRKDRYHQTVYTEELSMLGVKENGSYTLKSSNSDVGIPICNQSVTESRVEENRIEEKRVSTTLPQSDDLQPLNFDAEKVWKDTFAIYPKKSGAHPSKIAWLDFLKDIISDNQLDVAKLIFYAIKLYLADYKKKNPDDEDYRFIPRFDKWLKEDCQYWISVYEEQQRGK